MNEQPAQTKPFAGKTVISVDAMGGDLGPTAVVAGLYKAAQKNPDISFVLHQ